MSCRKCDHDWVGQHWPPAAAEKRPVFQSGGGGRGAVPPEELALAVSPFLFFFFFAVAHLPCFPLTKNLAILNGGLQAFTDLRPRIKKIKSSGNDQDSPLRPRRWANSNLGQ